MKANQYGNGPAVSPKRRLFGPIPYMPRQSSQGALHGDAGGSDGDPVLPPASVGVWVVFTGVIWGAFAVLSPVLGELPF
jgi:hypothetical protein